MSNKPSFGKSDGNNYAVCIADIDNDYYTQPFGRSLDARRIARDFIASANVDVVGAKGKATLAAIKAWVRDNKPSQFHAQWRADSANYKDDCVTIYYK